MPKAFPILPLGLQLKRAQESSRMHWTQKTRRKFPKILRLCSVLVSLGEYYLQKEESSPLQVMCGGAVNRQPGYRARNLQRRRLAKDEKSKIENIGKCENSVRKLAVASESISVVRNPLLCKFLAR